MEKLDNDTLRLIFEASPYERRGVEYKPPFRWTDKKSIWLKQTVIRAIIGMSNTKGGGYVVVGVEDSSDHKFTFKGLVKKQLESFENYEAIKGTVDSFVYGFVEFRIVLGEYKGNKYIIFDVAEFEETPNLCKKGDNAKDPLVKDDLYVRSKSSSPATIKATELELREILKMAADKEKTELEERGFSREPEPNVIEHYQKVDEDLE